MNLIPNNAMQASVTGVPGASRVMSKTVGVNIDVNFSRILFAGGQGALYTQDNLNERLLFEDSGWAVNFSKRFAAT